MEKSRRFFRPTWAEIDLSALRANLQRFKRLMGRRTKIMFVVKANAYGHGIVACAKAAAGGADWLGVSSVEEGVTLRLAGVRAPILVLGSLYPFESFLAAAAYRLTPTVASLESAQRLVAAARRVNRRLTCHLKIETGMGRIGVSPAAAVSAAQYLRGHPAVAVEGIYTHLACAETNRSFTNAQLKRFGLVSSAVRQTGTKVALRHAANSIAALRYPESRLDLVRPGLAIYGLTRGFEPVLSLKSKVVFLKRVARGTPISYGATFRTRRPSRIATIPIGYADGISCKLSNRGFALLGGRRCPIIGRVTMDMLMIDATSVPSSRVGDDVVFLGRQGRESIGVAEVAKTAGMIPYEITCALSARVPRVYSS